MLNAIINHLLVFSGWSAILLVFLLPALESSVFLGFVIPGETAVVVGGFLAYEHRVSLAGILAAGILGAIVGDSIGFAVGERWGDALLTRLPKRFVKPEHVAQGKQMITRLGGRAVFAGRWVSVLRALVPGLCGTSGMRYPTFLLWNGIGGITWATVYTMLGLLAGSAWQRVEHYTSVASYVVLAVILVAIATVVLLKRRRQHARDAETRREQSPTEETSAPETPAHKARALRQPAQAAGAPQAPRPAAALEAAPAAAASGTAQSPATLEPAPSRAPEPVGAVRSETTETAPAETMEVETTSAGTTAPETMALEATSTGATTTGVPVIEPAQAPRPTAPAESA